MAKRREFGRIDPLPSKRFRARYPDPTPGSTDRIPAPKTFTTKTAAQDWLNARRAEIQNGTWVHPDEAKKRAKAEAEAEAAKAAEAARRQITVGEYAEQYVQRRVSAGKLGGKTAYDYRLYWHGPRPKAPGQRATAGGRLHHFADWPIGEVTYDDVCSWHDEQLESGKLTQVTRCYEHLKTIMLDAEDRGVIARNPCRIKDAKASTGVKRDPPTDAELPVVISAMPLQLQPLVILAAAVGGRFGELTAFRKRDFVIEHDDHGAVECVRVTVDKAITYVPGEGRSEKGPKTEAGRRTVPFYGDDALIFASHLTTVTAPDQLLFTDATGDHPLPHGSWTHHWIKARNDAGRPDLQLHSLRHYHGTRYAQLSDASLAEVMARLGHTSVAAAMRYQHAGSRADKLARQAAGQA
ncbi:tyrosine-type recombinase/integrase [Gordonia jinhuaensis]|uniref:Integrase n=1 Tax=Gordonia jinhuaensis TaxID=1517702 RepID=A0A916WNP6_9ACTN|nr:tyrosine-type recombinase/integrase [Gordonia jinhuaensis]GGB18109.1 integrase [Gordonia jinhuaensis]